MLGVGESSKGKGKEHWVTYWLLCRWVTPILCVICYMCEIWLYDNCNYDKVMKCFLVHVWIMCFLKLCESIMLDWCICIMYASKWTWMNDVMNMLWICYVPLNVYVEYTTWSYGWQYDEYAGYEYNMQMDDFTWC